MAFKYPEGFNKEGSPGSLILEPLADGDITELSWRVSRGVRYGRDRMKEGTFNGYETFYKCGRGVNFDTLVTIFRDSYPVLRRRTPMVLVENPGEPDPIHASVSYTLDFHSGGYDHQQFGGSTPDGIVRLASAKYRMKFVMWPTECFGMTSRAQTLDGLTMPTYVGLGLNVSRARYENGSPENQLFMKFEEEQRRHGWGVEAHERQWREENERREAEANTYARRLLNGGRPVKVEPLPLQPYFPPPSRDAFRVGTAPIGGMVKRVDLEDAGEDHVLSLFVGAFLGSHEGKNKDYKTRCLQHNQMQFLFQDMDLIRNNFGFFTGEMRAEYDRIPMIMKLRNQMRGA